MLASTPRAFGCWPKSLPYPSLRLTPFQPAGCPGRETARGASPPLMYGLPSFRLLEKHMNSLQKQVGGNHYQGFTIPPVEFIQSNGLGFIEGCIIKYLCRYRKKHSNRREWW